MSPKTNLLHDLRASSLSAVLSFLVSCYFLVINSDSCCLSTAHAQREKYLAFLGSVAM